VVLDMAAAADKEATDKRAAEEAVAKRAIEERAAKEATAKAAVAEEVAGKTADEAAGAAGGSPAPGQAPSVAKAKRAVAPPHQPNVPTGVFGNLDLSHFVSLFFSFFPVGLHSLITLFAQVLSLRCGHHNGHGCFCHRHRCRRCGYRGDSRAGS
jgi:hypothetical protein